MKKFYFLLLIASVALLAGCVKIEPTRNSANGATTVTTNPAPAAVSPANKLDLSNRGLTKVSLDVFARTNLEELDVSGNNLTGALPAEIRHLAQLKVLDASNNQMTGVPAEIGQLKNLRILNLANNQLTGLPYELGNLKNLEILNLSGNPYSIQDFEIIRQGLPTNIEIIL